MIGEIISIETLRIYQAIEQENKELQESWLVLTSIVYKVNTTLLDILGIKVPEKM